MTSGPAPVKTVNKWKNTRTTVQNAMIWMAHFLLEPEAPTVQIAGSARGLSPKPATFCVRGRSGFGEVAAGDGTSEGDAAGCGPYSEGRPSASGWARR
jgi:hypothetical protein